MKWKRFTEEQITGVLREHEMGTKTTELCTVAAGPASLDELLTMTAAETEGW